LARLPIVAQKVARRPIDQWGVGWIWGCSSSLSFVIRKEYAERLKM
jgi:hypothetical protein